jgi:hypothetical protein
LRWPAFPAWLCVLPLLLGFGFNLETGSVTYSARDPQRSWQGTAPLTSVTLTPGPDGLVVMAILEPGAFSSGNFIRDGNARFSLFDVGRYPTATLTGTLPLAAEMTGAAPLSRTQTVPFSGQLTLHGVTRTLTFPVTVIREGAQARAEATFSVRLSAFGMKRPSLFGVVVDDRVDLSVSLTGVFGTG